MVTQKIYLGQKKVWIGEVLFFLDMNDLNFLIKSHREVRDNAKTVQLI